MPGRFPRRPDRRDLAVRCVAVRPLRFPRDTVWAAVGLFVVVAIFFALYYLLFTDTPASTPANGAPTKCGPSHVGCRLQANQGAIETFAIFVALVAAFIAIYQRNTDHRSVARRFEYWLDQAVYEAVHNLRHIADAFDGESLRHAPIYSLRLAKTLASEPLEGYLRRTEPGKRLWNHIDHMVRNDIFLQGLSIRGDAELSDRPAEVPSGPHESMSGPGVSAPGDFAGSPPEHPGRDQREWLMAQDATKYLVEHMLRFIADAVAGYEKARFECVLSRAVGKDPHCSPLRGLAMLLVAQRETEFYVRFHASWLARDEAEEQQRWGAGVTLTPLCWLDDRTEHSRGAAAPALVVGAAFASLGDPPIPPRPRSRA